MSPTNGNPAEDPQACGDVLTAGPEKCPPKPARRSIVAPSEVVRLPTKSEKQADTQ
jgi:hypothetical protein